MSKQLTLLFLLIVMGFNLFCGIGAVGLADPDEPVYAETAREMIEYNDYLSPRIYNEYWFDKPPMYYWLVAGTFKVFGISDWAARFPSALLGLCTVFMFYFSLKKLTNEDAAFWSSVVLGTSLEFFYLGKAAVTDMTLLFFMTSAIMAFLCKKYWLLYICMGLATLTKGPIGIVFPGAIIIFGLLVTGNIRRLKEIHFFRGMVLCLLVCSFWYILMYRVHGMEFINTFLGFHNITRFTSPEHPGRVLWYYYIPVVIVGIFPWAGMLLTSLRDSYRESSGEDFALMVFMSIWALFVFLFFSVSKTKLVSYIFPMFPPMAAIIGWNISRIIHERFPKIQYGMGIMSVGFLTLFAVAWTQVGNYLPAIATTGYLLSGITFVFVIGIALAFFKYNDMKLAASCHVCVSIITMFAAFSIMMPSVTEQFTTKELCEYYKVNCNENVPMYVSKFLRPGFMYYTHNAGIPVDRAVDVPDVIKEPGAKYVLLTTSQYKAFQEETKDMDSSRFTELYSKGNLHLVQAY